MKINKKFILALVLEKTLVKTPKSIAFGFSISALPLLERLQASKHVDQIFISNGSSFSLGKKIEGLFESSAIDFLKDHWKKNNKLIFLGSIGAVVRLISPFVKSKENDPSILVMDSKAKNVITILGGHKQGGDRFASEFHLQKEESLWIVLVKDGVGKEEERISIGES